MRAFVVTAEELHFGRAAERLFVSQQALSKRIRRLEQTLAAPLFERTTRTVELTDAGRRLLPHAVEAVSAFDRAVRSGRAVDEPLRVDVYDERRLAPAQPAPPAPHAVATAADAHAPFAVRPAGVDPGNRSAILAALNSGYADR